MASINKVILIGNLGKDPESKFLPSGDAVCNITVATTESWKDKNSGDKKEATEWHRVVFFKRLAEVAGQYLKKGSQVYVEGRLQTRKYQKDGVDHYSTEIVADTMKMLGSRQGSGDASDAPPRERQPYSSGVASRPQVSSASSGSSNGGLGDFEDDIPF